MRHGYRTTPRLRRSAGVDDPADRRREARLERALDARRAVGALRPRARRRRPVPPLEGTRADGVLRRARSQGPHPGRDTRRLRQLRLAARLPPRPRARAGRRDLERLTRSRARDRGRRRARGPAHLSASSATASSTRAATGKPCSGPAGSGSVRSPPSSSTTTARRTTGRAASRRASSSKAGTRFASTAVTTPRSKQPSAARSRRSRGASSPRFVDDDAPAVLPARRRGARRRSARRARVRGDRRRRDPRASALLQRRHPGAVDDRRRRGSRARGLPPRRALVHALRRRASV